MLASIDPSQNWSLVLLRAIVAIILGLVILFMPGPTLAWLVLLFAAYMLVDGVLAIISGARAARAGDRWGWPVLEGVLDLAAGVAALLWPGLTIIVLVTLMAVWALLTGVSMVIAAFRLNPAHGRGWLVAGGVVSVIWGVLLLVEPIAGALVMTVWLGAYALVFGIALLVAAIRMRRRVHRMQPGATA